MKKALIIAIPVILVLGIIAVLSFCRHGVANRESNRISSVGFGEAKATPDEIVLYLGVVKKNMDVTVAKQECDKVINGILKLADEYGVDKDSFQTDFIKIKQEYASKDGKMEFDGYVITENVVITLRTVDKFNDIFVRSIALGATTIHALLFNSTKIASLQEEAKDKALEDARRKAEWQAKQLGKKIIRIENIAEEEAEVHSWYDERAKWDSLQSYAEMNLSKITIETRERGFAAAGPQLSFGKINAAAKVNVTFVLGD